MRGVRVEACLEHPAEPEGCFTNITQDHSWHSTKSVCKVCSLQLFKAFPWEERGRESFASPLPWFFGCCLLMALWKSPPQDHRHLYAVLWVLQTVTRSSCQRWAEEKGHLHSVENIPFLLSILGPWILLNFSEAGSLGDGLELLLELVLQMMS